LANELGIFDMSGNVWEWCEDITENAHFIRGGSFSDNIGLDPIADTRYWGPSGTAYNDTGFRLARNLQANQSSSYSGSGTLSGTLNVSSSSSYWVNTTIDWVNTTIEIVNDPFGLSKVGAGTFLLGNLSSLCSGSATLSNGVLNVSSSSGDWSNNTFLLWNGATFDFANWTVGDLGAGTILLGDAGSLGGTSGQSLPTQDGTQSHATPPRPTPVMDPN
jgi:hypothetical protein